MGNVITLFKDEVYPEYAAYIKSLDFIQLLEEMVKFQESRSLVDCLTPELICKGKMLFRALELQATTQELRALSRSYRRYLENSANDSRNR